MPSINASITTLPPILSGYSSPLNFGSPQPLGGAGAPLSGQITNNVILNRYIYYPTTARPFSQKTVDIVSDYSNIFFNRIHVLPADVNVGNVSTTISYEVEVWNAYLEPNLLTLLQKLDAEGINVLNGHPQGTTFGPLESSIYDIEVTPSGPPVIEAIIKWTFGSEYGTHSIIGNRLILFPFRPAGPIVEILQWRTNILRAYSAEQRISLIKHPRQIWEMRYKSLQPSVQSRINSAMWGRNFQPFGLPIWTDVTYYYQALVAGQDTIYFDTRYFDYRQEGLLVLLYQDDITNESKEIAEVHDDHIVLVRPLENNFLAGALIMPVIICQPEGGLVKEDIGNDVTVSQIRFRALENLEYITSAPESYLGYEYLREWNIRPGGGSVKSSIIQPSVTVDSETGPWDVFAYRSLVDESVDFSFVADNSQDRWKNKMFLMRRRGSAKPFWVSSRRKDFVVTQQIGSTAIEITVENMGQENRDLEGSNHHIEIILKDGTEFKRGVIGLSSTSLDKEEQIIEISDSFGQQIDPDEIDRISYIRLVRLDTDEIQITHNLGIYSEFTIPVITVEQPDLP